MHNVARVGVALAIVLLGTMPASASAAVLSVDDVHRAARAALTPAASPSPCSDGAYKVLGGKWKSTLKWSFRSSSTPAGLTKSGVAGVLKESFGNITNANNDCGRSDRVGATSNYLGTTTRRPGCRLLDGHNVVGFRSLPAGVLGRTCWWTMNGRIIEADIQLSSSEPWALSLAACNFPQTMLEAVMTHEVGHAYGMGHVGESKHGRLTMSTYLDGACNNQESTLGRGDMLGLEAKY
jgi:hypothetical protein